MIKVKKPPKVENALDEKTEHQMRILANFLIDRILLDIKNGKWYK